MSVLQGLKLGRDSSYCLGSSYVYLLVVIRIEIKLDNLHVLTSEVKIHKLVLKSFDLCGVQFVLLRLRPKYVKSVFSCLMILISIRVISKLIRRHLFTSIR